MQKEITNVIKIELVLQLEPAAGPCARRGEIFATYVASLRRGLTRTDTMS